MTHMLLHLVAAIPNPGQGTAPPGGAKILTILKWLAWGVFAVCVAGVLLNGAKLAVAHQRGHGGGEQTSGLAWTLIGAIVAGSAAALVGAVA